MGMWVEEVKLDGRVGFEWMGSEMKADSLYA
jgi:hypothetical protein